MKKKIFLLPWLSLGCMVYGIWLCFCEIFECGVNRVSYLFPAFIIAGVVTFVMLQWERKVTLGLIGVSLVVVLLYSLRHIQQLIEEVQGILYYVNRRSEKYYQVNLFEEEFEKCSMEHTLIWILLGGLFALFIAFFAFRLKNRLYGLLPCYLMVSVGLFLGKAPGTRCILFLLAGMVLAIFWLNGQVSGGRITFPILKVGKQGNEWRRYLWFFLLMVITLVAAAQLTGRTKDVLLSHENDVQKKQMALEKKVVQIATDASKFIQGKLSIDSNGKLNNDEPKYADRPVLKITMQEKPAAEIYLKGFVGTRYHNGQWEQEDEKSFQELFPDQYSREEMVSLGFLFLNGNSELVTSYWDDEDVLTEDSELSDRYRLHNQSMEIEYVGRGKFSSYTYVPYFTNKSNMVDADTTDYLYENEDFFQRESIIKKMCSRYSFSFWPMTAYERQMYYDTYYSFEEEEIALLEKSYGLSSEENIRYTDFSDLPGDPIRGNQKELERYVDSVTNYEDDLISMESLQKYLAYAWEEYGYQEESTFFERKDYIEKLKDFNTDYKKTNKTANMNTMERVEFVKEILRKEAVYSKKLEPVPEGADYAEYFLLQQKKGFCEHFATAGTLLMRELGIPSRYVGGYRIPAKRFQKNDDGTYTAEVLDSDAHAWTEVLAGKLGWFPAEMTPASSSGAEERQKSTPVARQERVTPAPKKEQTKKQQKATPTVKPTPSIQPSAAPIQKKRAGEKKELPKQVILAGKIVGGFLVVLLVIALYLLSWRIYYNSRKKKVIHARGKNRSLYVRLRLYDMLLYLKGCGMAVAPSMPEKKWLSEIEKLFGENPSEEEVFSGEEFLRIVQKAAFSREEITVGEYDTFREYCNHLESLAWRKAGKSKRLFLKLTGREKDRKRI